MKNDKQKELLIEQLKKTPIIQVACEKTGISRATFYRWKINKEFAKVIEKAIFEGEALITDMTEHQLVSLIRDKNFPAIQLWLRVHHPKYTNKIEVNASVKNVSEELTPEQKALVEQALKLAALPEPGDSSQNHGKES